MKDTIGNTNEQSLEEIWNGVPLKEVRRKMLNNETVSGCTRCYEQDDMGFFSMRVSSNKHFGHHISLTDETLEDGTLPNMKIAYWDIRFSNLCNLRCRSCGHIFSSNWYDDQIKLLTEENGGTPLKGWPQNNKRIHFAGRTEEDMWQQLEQQIDNLEQVYFAGGEPLIMEEHYRLLKELLKRGRTDVRLVYNTNFTELVYKKTNVLELWKEFESVSIGASLDAMGPRAEYIRKNTDWTDVERNREQMLTVCPKVDFYISPTLSIMNAWHISDFHKDWVHKGFLKHQDLNINVLQEPSHYRVDIAPLEFKQEIKSKWEEHIKWLTPHDKLNRALTGFESAINLMMADDKTDLLPKFWSKTNTLDKIRNEDILVAIPELKALR
jgi:organic radical activating enzyme